MVCSWLTETPKTMPKCTHLRLCLSPPSGYRWDSLRTWLTLILKVGDERLKCHQITMHALRLGRGDIILLTNTHAALSWLPSPGQPFFGEARKPILNRQSRTSSAVPHILLALLPLSPFPQGMGWVINRVTEFASGYLWSTPLYSSSP